MRDCLEEYRLWRDSELFDAETRAEVKALGEEEIFDRFCCDLKFGTGGLRGKLGAGTNRMNRYTVGKASKGLADFLNGGYAEGEKSVVIAYDSRHGSKEFALDSALIFAANGIKVYLFEGLRPTPELSFAVRYFHATAGVVITASHNPPEYNGYKVYLSDGGQIVPPYDAKIIACVNAVKDLTSIGRLTFEEATSRGLLIRVGEEVDEAFDRAVLSTSLCPVGEEGRKLKIVYTPLNGTGNLPVRRILRKKGFENIFVVPEQEAPDGDFPTLERPNPEDPKAFTLALKLAREQDADLVIATDPDADRLGVCAKKKSGGYLTFTGNMCGILLADYVLSRRAERGLLPKEREKSVLVTTVVSSDMARPLAAAFGVSLAETLTGFKYIGEQIGLYEQDGRHFEFGFEESYGCLAGTYCRDKDAVGAVMLLAEAASYYAERGLTLADAMEELYRKYGCYRETLADLAFRCEKERGTIERIMTALREDLPDEIGGKKVLALRDYKTGVRTERSGRSEALTLPRSNVLYFELEGEGWCCVRPSGTEEKIKFYIGAKGRDVAEADEIAARVKEAFVEFALTAARSAVA